MSEFCDPHQWRMERDVITCLAGNEATRMFSGRYNYGGAALLVVAGYPPRFSPGRGGPDKLTSPAPSRTLGRVRMQTLTRRFLGGVLIVVAFATSAAPHNHPLGELLGGFSASGEHAVTTHDPHSRASHWHAVIRFVKENPCLACQWHRLSSAFSYAGLASPTLSVWPAEQAVPAALRSASLGRPSSRAPPPLL